MLFWRTLKNILSKPLKNRADGANMTKSFTIHDLPADERPRERLVKFGEQALSAQELLQLILGRGIAGESVAVTAQKLLSHFGSLQKLSGASVEGLSSIKGIGLAKATQIKAVFEIAKRINIGEQFQARKGTRKIILTPEEVFKSVKAKISNYAKEHFFVLSFDTRNGFLGIDEISVGTLDTNLVHPRETFDAAIQRHAANIIVAHNHPSGDPEPSDADEIVTKRLKEAGIVMEINLLDHVIVGKNTFYSFKDNGFL